MKSSMRRTAIAAALLVPVLAACGFGAQTGQVYQPADGTFDREGTIDALNVLIVSGTDGSGTLVAQLVNNSLQESDSLVRVSGEGITASEATVPIDSDGSVSLPRDAEISLAGDDIKAGGYVPITLSFSGGQTTDLEVPVFRRDGFYADIPVPGGDKTDKAGEESEPAAEGTPSGEATSGEEATE